MAPGEAGLSASSASLAIRARRLAAAAGFDRTLSVVLAGKLWSMAVGPLTLLAIARFLAPEEQGYYYTFNSILASLQVFFELGFGFVLTQCASHEMAGLSWTPDRQITGDPVRRANIAKLLAVSMRWYGVGSAIFGLTAWAGGAYFFTTQGKGGVAWQWPWTMVCIGSAVNLSAAPALAILDGMGRLKDTASIRVGSSLCATLFLWLVLAGGGKLYASGFLSLIMGMGTVAWLAARWGGFFLDTFKTDANTATFQWGRDIWPMQWRIAASWIVGSVAANFYSPLLFSVRGAVEAGQMGMTMHLITGSLGIGGAWVSTKAPSFGSFIARGDFSGLDRLFFSSLAKSLAVIALVGAGLYTVVLLARAWEIPYAQRVVGALPFAMLLLNGAAYQVTNSLAQYLRAHKREPFLIPTIAGSCLNCLLTWVLGRQFGIDGIAAGTLAVSALIGLPWAVTLFRQARREHAAGLSAGVGA